MTPLCFSLIDWRRLNGSIHIRAIPIRKNWKILSISRTALGSQSVLSCSKAAIWLQSKKSTFLSFFFNFNPYTNEMIVERHRHEWWPAFGGSLRWLWSRRTRPIWPLSLPSNGRNRPFRRSKIWPAKRKSNTVSSVPVLPWPSSEFSSYSRCCYKIFN